MAMLMDPRFSCGLPPSLSPHPGLFQARRPGVHVLGAT